jgi:lipopolysaccharide transport system permease protein
LFKNLKNIYGYRALIQSLVARELKARYRGSVLGFFWSFLNPLLLLLVYTLVFTFFLPQRGAMGDVQPYALFLFTGLLPWTWFSSSLLESSNVMSVNANLIQKIMFPAEVLPFVNVLANLCHFILGLPILLAFLIIFQKPFFSHIYFFPLIILVQMVLSLSLTLLISSLSVHFRDIRDLLANLMTLWFFTTPIIYPLEIMDRLGKWKSLFDLNPMTHIILAYQDVFIRGRLPSLTKFFCTALLSLIAFFICYYIFDRLRDTFAEEV